MDVRQKLTAMNAIRGVIVSSTDLSTWCARFQDYSVEIKDGAVLKGTSSYGKSPENAVDNLWKTLTELTSTQYVVAEASGSRRLAVRWNGFMWAPIDERDIA